MMTLATLAPITLTATIAGVVLTGSYDPATNRVGAVATCPGLGAVATSYIATGTAPVTEVEGLMGAAYRDLVLDAAGVEEDPWEDQEYYMAHMEDADNMG